MASIAYENVISEHFDVNDRYTLSTLLAIDENDQSKVLDSLTSKLYESIVNKVDDIDFTAIERTKGDITTLPNYEMMLECINIIKSILIEYRQDTQYPDSILETISNISDRKDMFMKAFALKIDLPIIVYNAIVMDIVYSITLLISTTIEFIKDAGEFDYKIKFDKISYVKTCHSLCYKNIVRFNKICSNGELDKSISHIMNTATKSGFVGTGSVALFSIVGTIGVVTVILPLLRELIYLFFHIKQSISDFFDIQADLLQMNAEYLKNNPNFNKSEAERKTIVKKQENIAKNFRKAANAIAIDNVKAEAKVQKDISSESKKKYKLDDVTTDNLDSAPTQSSSSSLF